MAWDPVTQPEDFAVVDGVRAPGVCTLTKFTKKRRLQKIEPYGARGARVISLGEYLAEWSFSVHMPDAAAWEDWLPFGRALDRVPVGPQGKAATIAWAPLALRGVQSCMIEQVDGPLPQDDGSWLATVSGCSWVPIPKIAISAPKEAQQPTAPRDPVEAQFVALSKQFVEKLNR